MSNFAEEFIENNNNNNNESYELLKDDDDYENAIINHKSEHDSLLKNLSRKYSTQKEHQWKSKRTEASEQVEKHGISKRNKTKSITNKLLQLLDNQNDKKSFKNLKKKKTILEPLREPAAKKVARQVNFKELNKEIAKYDPIVKQIRHAEQLVFPAEDEKLKFNITDSTGNKINQEIIKEINANLDNIESNEKFLTDNEMQVLKALDIEEARKLHQSIQRKRILLSYQEAKYRRIRRIKSKKYHRILKRDRLKKTVEDFNKLIAENSDKALEKIEELDKLRALERASLKHMNTGKWAKHNKIRAKYNDQSREELNEQLKISQMLMKKPIKSPLDDEDGQDIMVEDDKPKDDQSSGFIQVPHNYNPWESKVKPVKMIKVPIAETEKEKGIEINLEKVIEKRVKQRIQYAKTEKMMEMIQKDQEDDRIIDEGTTNKTKTSRSDLNSVFNNQTSGDSDGEDEHKDTIQNLNPQSLINSIEDVKNLIHKSNDACGGEDEDFDVNQVDFNDGEETENYLREAFAENDVIEEFLREKRQNESSKIEKESLYLPGFNSWAGFGIEENKRKIYRENKKLLNKQQKIDQKICNAIILEGFAKPKDSFTLKPKLAKPIGPMWTPQTICKTLTEPKIITKSGMIIEPMNPLKD